ncbi:MAG: rhamnogalacturonan acetylesterase [Alphaproteobacteria bacterium]|nr:rhamnogalacturonan acetylesterase [Alphaproteobacteria bacterium]MDE2110638.1 rhamnogalacturonan acetylesterase [Alphaproteobacteria bacterium]MDE2495067.1 rhamnogalacturonan acetylesterase [Alphaproteobacteria bacterium]
MILTPVTVIAQATPVTVPTSLSPTDDPSITDRPVPKPIEPVKIILVGDSTIQVGSGWGGSFCASHVTSIVACIDLGRGGRSTYSYRAEGSWDVALDEMKSGGFTNTYVLIQFGHNDQPGKPGRSTNLVTEFPTNLQRYVTEARTAGATPVLVTPLTRREFKNGVLQDDLEPWAEAVRKVAKEMNVPLVDLHADSAAAVQAMGAAAATRLAEMPPIPKVLAAAEKGTTIGEPKYETLEPLPPTSDTGPEGSMKLYFDYTHLSRTGADYFSKMVANELARAVPALRKDLLP